ncbi:MAG: hypothetical protein K6F39_06055 [Lachnospiraceae bacterium]|nr:hypothetical protein [Lachnospiraceae bacterium]
MENNQEELLKQILEATEKSSRYQKRCSQILGLLLIVVAAAAIFILPGAYSLIHNANETVTDAKIAVANIQTMSQSITETSERLNTMVSENTVPLSNSVQKLSSIDFDGLNTAIEDLQDAVGPFAKMMRTFK